jgi:TIR domain
VSRQRDLVRWRKPRIIRVAISGLRVRVKMSRIHEYYEKTFTGPLTLDKQVEMRAFEQATGKTIYETIHVKVLIDFPANVRFLSVYLTDEKNAETVAAGLLANLNTVLMHQGVSNLGLPHAGAASAGISLRVENRNPESILAYYRHFGDGPEIEAGTVPFSGRIYIFSEFELDEQRRLRISRMAQSANLSLRFRGPHFASEVDRIQKPKAFISHDSRDKASIALPIALGLQRMMCPVWYDEFSMSVGQSLRESIESGIKQCGYCILVLTPNFLRNGGWPKREYTMAFTKELVEEENRILPVWQGVTKKEVYEYSPHLADRLAVSWDLGEEEVCRRLYRAIDKLTGADRSAP